MGTRHRQAVINKDGKLIIQQYGQWDGYPSGQGVDILNYLRNADLVRYQENLEKIPLINDEQDKELENTTDWQYKYPYMSRDCGANIHQLIEDGVVKFVAHIPESEARQWCDGFYTIDFSKNVFISEFYGTNHSFDLDRLPSDDVYLAYMDDDEIYLRKCKIEKIKKSIKDKNI